MDNIIMRQGRSEDAQDFSQLILISSTTFFHSLFTSDSAKIMRKLFQKPGNLFSFEHSHFIEVDDKIAGMVLGYNWAQKSQEELYTGLLMVKYLKWNFFARIFYFLKAQDIVGKVSENEYYLSNIAVYPEFRGLGLGTKLLSEIERESKKSRDKKIVLDVETNNKRAIKLYERIGYIIESRMPSLEINKETFEFFRMSKVFKYK
jgi:ribosomal protein S18 acetylase RimI-like enzyme